MPKKSACSIYRVLTETGNYILKIHTGWTEELEQNIYFINYLNNQGFPAPQFIQTRNKKSYISIGRFNFELQKYIDNDNNRFVSEPICAEHYLRAASLLGVFHKISRNYGSTISKKSFLYRADDNKLLSFGSFHLLFFQPIYRGCTLMKDTFGSSRLDFMYQGIIIRALDLLSNIHNRAAAALLTNMKIVNHGDVHIGNFLFKEQKIKALIDFDFCRTDTCYYDLLTLLGFGMVLFNPYQKITDRLSDFSVDHEFADEMFSHYLKETEDMDISAAVVHTLLSARTIGIIFAAMEFLNIDDKCHILDILSKLLPQLERFDHGRSI